MLALVLVAAIITTTSDWGGEEVVYDGDFYEEARASDAEVGCDPAVVDLWQVYGAVRWEQIPQSEPMDPPSFARMWSHGQPIVVRGGASDWPAITLWTLGSLRGRCARMCIQELPFSPIQPCTYASNAFFSLTRYPSSLCTSIYSSPLSCTLAGLWKCIADSVKKSATGFPIH